MPGVPGRPTAPDQSQRLTERPGLPHAPPTRSETRSHSAPSQSRCRRMLVVAACGTGPARSGPATLSVVATTTVFADIVHNVGGERVTVSSIIPAGVGPGGLRAETGRRQEARRRRPHRLERGRSRRLSRQAGHRGRRRRRAELVLGDGIPTIDVDGEPNPHFWLDPSLVASHYVPAIAAALTKLDPAGAATYAANADGYTHRARARSTPRTRPSSRRSRSRTASSSRSMTRFPTSRPTTASR